MHNIEDQLNLSTNAEKMFFMKNGANQSSISHVSEEENKKSILKGLKSDIDDSVIIESSGLSNDNSNISKKKKKTGRKNFKKKSSPAKVKNLPNNVGISLLKPTEDSKESTPKNITFNNNNSVFDGSKSPPQRPNSKTFV